MNKKTTPSRNKLRSYSALAGSLLATAGAADAQIVYTNITDYTGSNQGDSCTIDLNNDGTYDFVVKRFDITTSYYSSVGKGVAVRQANSNAVAFKGTGYYSTSALALPMKTTIDASKVWLNNNTYSGSALMGINFGQQNFGPWTGTIKDRYLGLRFENGGNTYYGWARLDVTVTTNIQRFTLKDYAYHTTPNTAILAGNTGLTGLETYDALKNLVRCHDHKITVVLGEGNGTEALISVSNVLGQEVRSVNAKSRETVIDMYGSASGVYFVTINAAGRVSSVKVFHQ